MLKVSVSNAISLFMYVCDQFMKAFAGGSLLPSDFERSLATNPETCALGLRHIEKNLETGSWSSAVRARVQECMEG